MFCNRPHILYELRFRGAGGARFFTNLDVRAALSSPSQVMTVPVAASVSAGAPLRDARSCIAAGDVIELTTTAGAIAYVLTRDIGEDGGGAAHGARH